MQNNNGNKMLNKIYDRVQAKSSAGKFFMILGLIVAFVLFVVAMCSVNMGESGFFLQIPCVYLLSIILIITGIVEKVKMLYIVTPVVDLIYGLTCVGVMNDFPYFIRSIPGEKFIGIWFSITISIIVTAFLVEFLVLLLATNNKADIAKKKVFSDGDLMLLQNFDKFKLSGYYLLKAKLHNIVKYKTTPATEDIDSIPLVELNRKIPQELMDKYCSQNPQVSRIVSYLNTRAEIDPDAYVTVSDIIYNANPLITIHSDGGKFAEAFIEKIKKTGKVFWGIGTGLAFYLGYIKLMMGMYNEKEITNLMFTLFFYVGGVVLLYFLNRFFVEKIIEKFFIAQIVDFKRKPFGNMDALFAETDFDSEMTKEDRTRLLRAYTLYKYIARPSLNSLEKTHYSTVIFSSIISAQVATSLQKNSSSGSGCSSCGGCGGCGGGCGGCGGCGD